MKSRTRKSVILMQVLTALVVLAILSSMGVPRFPEPGGQGNGSGQSSGIRTAGRDMRGTDQPNRSVHSLPPEISASEEGPNPEAGIPSSGVPEKKDDPASPDRTSPVLR